MQADLRQLYSSVTELIRQESSFPSFSTSFTLFSSFCSSSSSSSPSSSLTELARHFWDAFPPNTPELAEKVGSSVLSAVPCALALCCLLSA